jgi:DNA-directed RNA polymerase subunit RPC12/RpoP
MADSPPKTPGPSTDSSTAVGTSAPPTSFAKPPDPPKRLPSIRESSNDPSHRLGKRPRPNPPPMTAAAALEDKRRAEKSGTPPTETTVNPANQVLSTLMGVDHGATSAFRDRLSRPATTISQPLDEVAKNLKETPNDTHSDGVAQTSPVSLSSIGTLESNVAMSGMETTTVDSPRSIGDASHDAEASPEKSAQEAPPADDAAKSFSYPGPMLRVHMPPSRGMSLPGPDTQPAERSSSNKKHRCPYCATEFTRHHNLKSHLLTHSQEKPYVCQTCQSRFRRLHDLKRHAKLHTGERPHICPKCGRPFARGDALARHNKGPGGCAGRRGSTGSFGADNDYEGGHEESMDGPVYGEPEAMDEDEASGARQSVPSIRRQAPALDVEGQATEHADFQTRQPNTYPPIHGRPPGGSAAGLFPPPGVPGGSGSSRSKPSPGGGTSYPSALGSSSSLRPAASGGTVFSTGSMTESPKPLSPGAPYSSHAEGGLHRNTPPSMTSQLQQQPYGRGTSRRTPPPPVPMGALSSASGQLPPPHPPGLNPPDARYTLPSQGPAHPPTGPTGPPTHMSGGGLSSHSNSLSSHGQSAKGSGEHSSAVFGPRDDRLWAYVKSLEDRVNGLHGEVASLKDQLAAASQPKPR